MKPIQNIKLYKSAIDPLGIPLYLLKGDSEITAFNLACEFCKRHGYSSWRNSTYGLYLLRGQASDPENLLMAVLEIPQLAEDLTEVINLVAFYNQHSKTLYRPIKKRGETLRDTVLSELAMDCQKIVNQCDDYLTGYGSSHIWIGERFTGRRVLLIHF